MLIVGEVRSAPGADKESVVRAALRIADIPQAAVLSSHLVKVSVDARKADKVVFVHSVGLVVEGDEGRFASPRCRVVKKTDYVPVTGTAVLSAPPVVAGFGPAGMFAALLLAKNGYRPIVLERGGPVEERTAAVDRYFAGGPLDPECNIQFGEGGAGTYSDGKLTTRIGDPRCDFIKSELVRFGAPDEILVKAKPHIGTDKLRAVVTAIREEIIRLGGTVHFHAKLSGLVIKDGALRAVHTGIGEIETSELILAVGHSARDTFEMLHTAGVPMEEKPFSVGVRIEHLQADVDRALYGKCAGSPLLPPAEYQYSHRKGEDAVYTFCMCPGGTVVAAASETGTIVTNGMSRFSRDGVNANSALVASVSPADFGQGLFSGMHFQRELEHRAFMLSAGAAPTMTVGTFLGTGVNRLGRVRPSYPGETALCDLRTLFPPRVQEMLSLGLRAFETRQRGFSAPDAVLTGPETRTSSPVRIPRGENFMADGLRGLYPCGEGAGYAGGILSAAADGLRTAEALMANYCPFD